MFEAIRSGEAENSLKSVLPQAMSRTTSNVHLSPMRSSVHATGHTERFVSFTNDLFDETAFRIT
jgi:hypothetical protein